LNWRVEHLEATALLTTPLVDVTRVGCCQTRSGAGPEEWNAAPQVVLPLRGLFEVHRRCATVLVEPTAAIVFGLEEAYRVSHPLDAGDECLVLEFATELHEEAFGRVEGTHGRLSARSQLGAVILASAIGRNDADPLAWEEGAIALLEAVACDVADGAEAAPHMSTAGRARADDVRALLADDIARRWRLADLGRAVHCSPFHLARQFRAATGVTISAYLLRLRLSAALERIAQGETDLARLAAELGFAHHSHFTARFRSVFGCTPAAARADLVAPRADYLRTIVTAGRPGRA
jgi:AraC family transcriptional regulator